MITSSDKGLGIEPEFMSNWFKTALNFFPTYFEKIEVVYLHEVVVDF